jgi:hypothetical protein
MRGTKCSPKFLYVDCLLWSSNGRFSPWSLLPSPLSFSCSSLAPPPLLHLSNDPFAQNNLASLGSRPRPSPLEHLLIGHLPLSPPSLPQHLLEHHRRPVERLLQDQALLWCVTLFFVQGQSPVLLNPSAEGEAKVKVVLPKEDDEAELNDILDRLKK